MTTDGSVLVVERAFSFLGSWIEVKEAMIVS
jgi:hypothetical protein